MRILIAPDKFKGSLSAMDVGTAISEGLKLRGMPISIDLHPMADGGDGSLEVIDMHLNLKKQVLDTYDPLGRPLNAFYYKTSNIAFVEVAKSSGLVLLKQEELNPLKTSTYGSGLMIADAISKGCDEIFLFLGGSATNDGGMGIASALGVQFYDHKKNILPPCGENLSRVDSILVDPVFDIEKTKITLLCDVNNPLFGPNGAAHIYARQKGADDQMIQQLDQGLQHFSEKLLKYSGIQVADLPGSGAAGGIAAALVSIFNAQLRSGIESFIDLTNLEAQVQKADLVISGEGRIDQQSLQGKVIKGISDLCVKYDKPLVLFVGKNDLSKPEQKSLGVDQIYSVFEQANSLDDAIGNASMYLKQLAGKV